MQKKKVDIRLQQKSQMTTRRYHLKKAVMKILIEVSSPSSAAKILVFNKMVTHDLAAKVIIKMDVEMHSNVEDAKCMILNNYL